MPDYCNFKIYKITSPSTEKIYIGSTHIYKLYINDINTKEYSSSNEILAYGNFNNSSELKKKNEYIKANTNICVNNSGCIRRKITV